MHRHFTRKIRDVNDLEYWDGLKIISLHTADEEGEVLGNLHLENS